MTEQRIRFLIRQHFDSSNSVSGLYLWIGPRPRLPMTRESILSSSTPSQIFSLASPQYSLATTLS